MVLEKLSLVNFRNYESLEVEFGPSVNCFFGRNGSGKSNILEAVHYLCMTKGYFSTTDQQNIRHGGSMFIVNGRFSVPDGGTDTVNCSLKTGQKKRLLFNGNEYQKLSEHIGKYPVVMVAPADQALISGGSDIRRRLMDSIISQTDRGYLSDLLTYNQSLLQRNALLKKIAVTGYVDHDSLGIWNQRLSDLGVSIFEKRKDFITKLGPVFLQHYTGVCGGSEEPEISHVSSLYDENLIDSLNSSLTRDLELKYTTRGIHKDDLLITLNGHPVKKFASQGQQKSVTIALKLAQFSYFNVNGSQKPIILLDDIFDKLDRTRVQSLLELISGADFGQVFITDTSESMLDSLFSSSAIPYKMYSVNSGEAMERQNALQI
jgi:DNA replication and repair protein RecF